MSEAPRLQELVDQWRRLAVSGIVLTAGDLCIDCPELQTELQQRIDQLRDDPQFIETRLVGDSEFPSRPPAPPKSDHPSEIDVQSRVENLHFYKRGGLGELYVGREESLQRQVAIKFIQGQFADNPETRSLFVAESEITARLDHPGVVPVYGLGHTPEGRPFLVMRLIRGHTLDESLEEFHRRGPKDPGDRSVAFRSLLSRVISVCHTLAYAHNRGILHRDIKPQNIMLGKYGETLVVDWGLALAINRSDTAKASGEETLAPESSHASGTTTGGAIGTPSYMSPEQAHGDIPLTSTSDIYSLGATLYKVLTGVVPVSGRSSSEILDKVKRGEFPTPRTMHRDVPRPLEAICLKAMAFNPEQRYPTATEMADDLERWLADEPVHAYPERGVEQLRRVIRRHRTWAQAIAITTLTLLIVGVPLGMFVRSSLVEQERVAQQLRVSRLREAATYAGATFAAEIDLRWRILQRDASDEKLRAELSSNRPLEEVRKVLDPWIHEKAEYNSEFANADSWFVVNASGFQTARFPASDKSTGRWYGFRTYFHGQELEIPEEPVQKVDIYSHVHRSVVFQGTNTGKPQITFSVPIWDSDAKRKVLGRLAMTVQLGKFRSLNLGLGDGQAALLVDLQKYKKGQSGVVLQHPQWTKGLPDDMSIEELPTLPPELVAQLNDLRRDQVQHEAARNLTLTYTDPVLGPKGGQWLATFEPVFVKQRLSNSAMDTGLMVIVQTPAAP